tara:strand:+ start:4863 stop:5579 length:717 start_codon:yes stop_codon:yes gene_type:complete
MSLRLLYEIGKNLARRKANPSVTKAGRWPDRDHTPVGRGDQPTVPERGAIPKGPVPSLTEKEGLESLQKIREGKNWFIDPKTAEVFEFRYGAGVEPRGFYRRYQTPTYVERAQSEAIKQRSRETTLKEQTIERGARPKPEVKPIELDQIFFKVRINEMNRIAQKAGYKNFQHHTFQIRGKLHPTEEDKLALQKYKEIFEELGPYTKDAELYGKTPIPREHFKYNTGGPVELIKLNYGY